MTKVSYGGKKFCSWQNPETKQDRAGNCLRVGLFFIYNFIHMAYYSSWHMLSLHNFFVSEKERNS